MVGVLKNEELRLLLFMVIILALYVILNLCCDWKHLGTMVENVKKSEVM